jgi:hypothetical protein
MTDNHDPHVGALVYCASVTLREVLPMTRTKIAFLVAAVFAFLLTAQEANAASVNLAGAFAARSSLVLQTHGCHRLCRHGFGPSRPYGYHRHAEHCVPIRCREWNWGWLPWRWLNVRPD